MVLGVTCGKRSRAKSKMRAVLLALALLPGGTAMGFGTEPEGIIYTSVTYVTDPVNYCS